MQKRDIRLLTIAAVAFIIVMIAGAICFPEGVTGLSRGAMVRNAVTAVLVVGGFILWQKSKEKNS